MVSCSVDLFDVKVLLKAALLQNLCCVKRFNSVMCRFSI